MTRPRSVGLLLALVWVVLIGYASLYPFGPWRLPPTGDWVGAFVLPWPRYRLGFDMFSNALGYLPLGMLVAVAAYRLPRGALVALLAGVAFPAALSYLMEVLQYFLAGRVPSALDFALNVAGAAAGAALALAVVRLGAVERLHKARTRWFVVESAGAMVLLLMWPVGLLFPAPVPFGLGQVFGRLRDGAVALLDDTPWQMIADDWPAPELMQPLGAGAETLAIALGLLAPCLVAYAVAEAGWRRLLVLPVTAALGFAAATLSTAPNFGPAHALAWITPNVLPATLLALAVGVAAAWAPRRAAAGIGLVAITALIVLIAQAPADPYYAQSLFAWEQGRFIRFHGLAQWIGWLWPYAALGVLLAHVGSERA